MTGILISLDGSESTGKSTQIAHIKHYLETHGKTTYCTREPGGSVIGEKIRELLLDERYQISAQTELLLLTAARLEHLEKEILPRIKKGQWIISDRFNDATYAYQGFARGLGDAPIALLEKNFLNNFQPQLSLILELKLEESEKRLHKRGQKKDRIEQEGQDFFKKVQQGYQIRAKNCTHVHLIDASGDEKTVFSRIKPHLDHLLKKHP